MAPSPIRLLLLLLMVALALLLAALQPAGAWVAPPSGYRRPPPPRLFAQDQGSSADDGGGDHRTDDKPQPLHSRADALRRLALGGSAAAAALSSVVGLPAVAGAAAVAGGKDHHQQQQQQQQQQQHQLGGPTYREKGRPALVEALVYLPKGVNYWGELLPDDGSGEEGSTTGAEALFLTASYEGRLVLGARVPMQGIIFPFLAQFYPPNVIPARGRSAEETWEAVKDKDLVVRARVCASGEYPPCETALLRAASLSKFLPLVRDPNRRGGEQEGEGEVIARSVRVGASLMLRPPAEATTLDEMRRVGGQGRP